MNVPILEAADVTVHFGREGRFTSEPLVVAVSGVGLTIERGQIVALVGESGSGKSTFARAISGLVPATGSVRLNGTEVLGMPERARRRYRRTAQMVFQDPYSSLDPSGTVQSSVAEPLIVHRVVPRPEINDEVGRLLEMVGLPASAAQRYPDEFSGGQRQRIAIARALAVQPDLLVCDEAVSALDASTRNQILNLLIELRSDLGISVLFISHDMSVVRHLADRIAVMYAGRIVEEGPGEQVFITPQHPYTRRLLDSTPVPDPSVERERRASRRVAPLPVVDITATACKYFARCDRRTDRCSVEPALVPVEGTPPVAVCPEPHVPDDAEHLVRCIHPLGPRRGG